MPECSVLQIPTKYELAEDKCHYRDKDANEGWHWGCPGTCMCSPCHVCTGCASTHCNTKLHSTRVIRAVCVLRDSVPDACK